MTNSDQRFFRPIVMAHDEMTETVLTPADLEQLSAEYRIAETEVLQLCTPDTRPLAVIVPFRGAPQELVDEWNGRTWGPRHAKPPRMRLTGRGVAVLALLSGALAGAGAGWLW